MWTNLGYFWCAESKNGIGFGFLQFALVWEQKLCHGFLIRKLHESAYDMAMHTIKHTLKSIASRANPMPFLESAPQIYSRIDLSFKMVQCMLACVVIINHILYKVGREDCLLDTLQGEYFKAVAPVLRCPVLMPNWTYLQWKPDRG